MGLQSWGGLEGRAEGQRDRWVKDQTQEGVRCGGKPGMGSPETWFQAHCGPTL